VDQWIYIKSAGCYGTELHTADAVADLAWYTAFAASVSVISESSPPPDGQAAVERSSLSFSVVQN